MHELPFTERVIAIILEEAEGVYASKINKVELTIGKLSGILPACVQFAFSVLSRKTLAEGAKLEFHEPEGQVLCRSCKTVFNSKGFDDLSCPNCQKKKIEVLSGKEFTVDSIEWE